MNSSPSRLYSQEHTGLVLDASALINILGSTDPALILRAINRPVFIDEIVLAEVHSSPLDGRSTEEIFRTLTSEELLKVVRLSDEAYEVFVDLTGATPPEDLDDGEAATLAQAIESRFVPIIDDRKAIRVASIYFPELAILSSLDLFGCEDLMNALDDSQLTELLHNALRNARMRVPPAFRDWVMKALGPNRLANCPSIGCRHLPADLGITE